MSNVEYRCRIRYLLPIPYRYRTEAYFTYRSSLLNTQQLDKVLARFQLVSHHHTTEQKIEIVKCIGLYETKLGEYASDDVLVGFNKAGHFHDMKSRDDTVKLFEDTCICNICSRSVDKKDIGIRCSGCTQFFHNKCSSSPLSPASFNQLVNTPAWVKVFCPKCMVATNKSEEFLEDIKQSILEKIEENNKERETASYSTVVSKRLQSDVQQTNKLVGDLVRRQTGTTTTPQDREEKNENTRLIKKPLDKKIRNSGDIRKVINNEYPGKLIRSCKTTAGGSIIIEFDDKDSAQEVEDNWRPTLFGGN